jgi:hypothetical protein
MTHNTNTAKMETKDLLEEKALRTFRPMGNEEDSEILLSAVIEAEICNQVEK